MSTQAFAVERAVLELSNVLRAVFILINSFSFHTAGLGPALVGREGVHECCLLPGGPASGLGVLQVAAGCVVLPRVSFLRLLGAASPVWANVTKSPRLPIPMLLSMGSSGSSQASVRVPQRTPGRRVEQW